LYNPVWHPNQCFILIVLSVIVLQNVSTYTPYTFKNNHFLMNADINTWKYCMRFNFHIIWNLKQVHIKSLTSKIVLWPSFKLYHNHSILIVYIRIVVYISESLNVNNYEEAIQFSGGHWTVEERCSKSYIKTAESCDSLEGLCGHYLSGCSCRTCRNKMGEPHVDYDIVHHSFIPMK
jgi:hypothetical protein